MRALTRGLLGVAGFLVIWELFGRSRLVPSEYSSGGSRVQGPITKTGNSHARRLLVEAAWHHRARYTIGSWRADAALLFGVTPTDPTIGAAAGFTYVFNIPDLP